MKNFFKNPCPDNCHKLGYDDCGLCRDLSPEEKQEIKNKIMDSIKNFGVKLGERLGDYRANERVGVLQYKEVVSTGNWKPWLPPGERQYNDNGDSMSCVTFSALNSIETQEKNQTNKQPEYSDRWIAKMSDTQRDGNYLWKVAETIRKVGLVLESSYPRPNGNWTWDEYHKEIPEPLLSKLKAEGQEWLKKWDVTYEVIDLNRASLLKHMKHGPLQIIFPNHAVMNFHTTQDVINYFDSYEPWEKTRNDLTYAMKIVLTARPDALDPDSLLIDIKKGESGKQVLKLKRALSRLGWGKELESVPGDMYDSKLAEIVSRYKLSAVCEGMWERAWERFFYKGHEVDQRTRDVINKALN